MDSIEQMFSEEETEKKYLNYLKITKLKQNRGGLRHIDRSDKLHTGSPLERCRKSAVYLKY